MKDWGQIFYCIFENKMLVYYKLPNMLQSMKVTNPPDPSDPDNWRHYLGRSNQDIKEKRKSSKWKNLKTSMDVYD